MNESYSKGEPKRQANFLLPERLIKDLRDLVPAKQRSLVVANAVERELSRIRARMALGDYFGAWKNARA